MAGWATFNAAVAWSCGDPKTRGVLLAAHPQSPANALKGPPRTFQDASPVKILQSTFLDWALCFSQLMGLSLIPAYCFAIP